jgi:hypothetical protein
MGHPARKPLMLINAAGRRYANPYRKQHGLFSRPGLRANAKSTDRSAFR